MLFHGKALEIYTAAYQNIQNIDENEDLEVRVIKICFSIYLLQKKSFHTLRLYIRRQKMQLRFQVPKQTSCVPNPFLHFCSKSMQVYKLRDFKN